MNDKPRDRTTKWMSIIAIVLVLLNALGNLIYRIITGEDGMGVVYKAKDTFPFNLLVLIFCMNKNSFCD